MNSKALRGMHLPRPTALITSHTPLPFESSHTCLCSLAETIPYKGLCMCCFLYQESPFSLPLSLLPNTDSFILLFSALSSVWMRHPSSSFPWCHWSFSIVHCVHFFIWICDSCSSPLTPSYTRTFFFSNSSLSPHCWVQWLASCS